MSNNNIYNINNNNINNQLVAPLEVGANSSSQSLINNKSKIKVLYSSDCDTSIILEDLNNYEQEVIKLINIEEGRRWDGSPVGRYCFDNLLCSGAFEYSQLDNRQDAWYYGTWINLNTYHYLSYCEGDIYFKSFDSLLELLKYIVKDWHSVGFELVDGMSKKFKYYNESETLTLEDIKAIIKKEELQQNDLNIN